MLYPVVGLLEVFMVMKPLSDLNFIPKLVPINN